MDKRNLIKISRWVVMAVFCFSLNVAKAEEPLQRNLTEQTKEEETQTPQATITARPAQEIELEVVWEKQFDEPVVDVIFDEAETTIKEAKALGWKDLGKKRDNEKVKILSPNVEFIPEDINFRKNEQEIKAIKFYDKRGSFIKKIEIDKQKNEGVSYSQNKKYIVVYQKPTEYEPENRGGAVYKADGILVWEINKTSSPIAVSDEGYVIGGELDWGEYAPDDFIFYDPSGKELGRVKNPYKTITNPDPEGVGYAQFSPSGEYALVGYTDGFAKTTIILTTKEGRILWQKEIEDCMWIPTRESDFVENVGVVGVGSKVYFIDWNGNLKWIVPLDIQGDMNTKLSLDKKKVFIISSVGYIWCIEVLSGKILWKHKEDWTKYIEIAKEKLLLKDKDREGWKNYVSSFDRYDIKFLPYFREMEITKDYVYVIGKYLKWAGSDAGLWRNSLLYIFDSENGTLIQKTEYHNRRISLISQNNKIFILDIDSKKISQIKIKVEK